MAEGGAGEAVQARRGRARAVGRQASHLVGPGMPGADAGPCQGSKGLVGVAGHVDVPRVTFVQIKARHDVCGDWSSGARSRAWRNTCARTSVLQCNPTPHIRQA